MGATVARVESGKREVGSQRLLLFRFLVASFIFIVVSVFFSAAFGGSVLTFAVMACFAGPLAIALFFTRAAEIQADEKGLYVRRLRKAYFVAWRDVTGVDFFPARKMTLRVSFRRYVGGFDVAWTKLAAFDTHRVDMLAMPVKRAFRVYARKEQFDPEIVTWMRARIAEAGKQ